MSVSSALLGPAGPGIEARLGTTSCRYVGDGMLEKGKSVISGPPLLIPSNHWTKSRERKTPELSAAVNPESFSQSHGCVGEFLIGQEEDCGGGGCRRSEGGGGSGDVEGDEEADDAEAVDPPPLEQLFFLRFFENKVFMTMQL